jgi:dipeptidyl aminopeptidase/acylaminoacyl peptidase
MHSTKEATMRKLLTLALLAVIAALVPGLAGANPRGTNGQILFDRADPTAAMFGKSLHVANPDGSGASLLRADSCCASWSHDGSRVAVPYITADGRVGTGLVGADGSDYKPLPIDDATLNAPCAPWSSDDTELLCQGWDNSNPARAGIYTMSADGGPLTRITSAPPGGADEPGSYSPDGKRIVFGRFDQNDNSLGLFVLKLNDGQLRQITPLGTLIQSGNDGDWSPQGNEIVFSRHVTADVRGSLWVVHADGSDLHEIHVQGLACGGVRSDPAEYGCHGPRWSPDGQKIVFAANSATGSDIYTVNADGSDLTQVTHDGRGNDNPAWGTHPLTP